MAGNGNETALDRFVAKMRDLFAREQDLDKRWAEVPPLLQELLADNEVREASYRWPAPGRAENRGGNLIFYEDPDYGFVINGQVHPPRAVEEPKAAHDHGAIYTAYGLLEGHERIIQFQRTDDGSRPDHAEVRKTADHVAGPGDIHLARPRDIHVETSIGERTTSIIVRSKKDGIPTNLHGRYNLETGAYHESIGPRQVPAELIPGKTKAPSI